jgi:hypothetical protein
MGAEERHRIISGVVKAHFWLARQLREWASDLERQAGEQERRETIAWQNDTSPKQFG